MITRRPCLRIMTRRAHRLITREKPRSQPGRLKNKLSAEYVRDFGTPRHQAVQRASRFGQARAEPWLMRQLGAGGPCAAAKATDHDRRSGAGRASGAARRSRGSRRSKRGESPIDPRARGRRSRQRQQPRVGGAGRANGPRQRQPAESGAQYVSAMQQAAHVDRAPGMPRLAQAGSGRTIARMPAAARARAGRRGTAPARTQPPRRCSEQAQHPRSPRLAPVTRRRRARGQSGAGARQRRTGPEPFRPPLGGSRKGSGAIPCPGARTACST